MKKFLFSIAAVVLFSTSTSAQKEQVLSVSEVRLSNGMTVWLNEDHSQPKVYGAVVVKAGAVDCPNTGIAHYFEHIMFKGTDRIGTTNYTAEKVYLDSIAAQYELLAQTTDNLKRKEIQKKINQLSIKAGDYAIPNEFNRLIAEYGGTDLNAGTSYDYTFYHNVFSPQYMRQWLTLNSHRLLHPVYRLFQGELETVYEEKNRSSDNIIMGALEKGLSEMFKGTPYEYPIIGSTENLKNPRMSEMEAFYKKFYVPSNMGLVLCGDFNSEEVKGMLEETFGRLPKADPPKRELVKAAKLTGQRTVKLKIPLPLIKATALAFRAPADFDADAPALDLATKLLSNDGETGLLDSLSNNHKILAGLSGRMSLNGIGTLIVASIPKLPFGKKAKAEKMCWEQVEKIKRGEFSEQALDVLKMETQREESTALEDLEGRAAMMVDLFAQGRNWSDYLQQVENIRNLTKADIVRVANRYFTDDFIRFVKKFGEYDKDLIEKPGFDPVRPKNLDAESDYARELRQMPVEDREVRLLDFAKDAQIVPLHAQNGASVSGSRVFATKNPQNDIFKLSLRYHRGRLNDPMLEAVAGYVGQLGTDSLKLQQFKKAMQQLGTAFDVAVNKRNFILSLTGFDRNLMPSLRLLGHFMRHAKADEEARKDMISSLKASFRSIWKSNQSVFTPILSKVMYGQESEYLNHVTPTELKNTTSETLLKRFHDVQQYACDIIYSGALDAQEVRTAVCEALPLSTAVKDEPLKVRRMQTYQEPVVYFYNMPSARQTLLCTYQGLTAMPSDADRARLELLSSYFGGGMSSILFQEIREFRSMAYSTGSTSATSVRKDYPCALLSIIGTQADKSMQALAVLDSLQTDLPLRQRNFDITKKTILSDVNNEFPSFRDVGETIADLMREGKTEDPNGILVKNVPQQAIGDVKTFYEQRIKTVPRTTIIVGNKKKLNFEELSRYGRIVEMERTDFFKQ